MCLCKLSCTAGQREQPLATFSTAGQRHWSPIWSLSSRQESNPSLSSLLEYSSLRASSSQESVSSSAQRSTTSLSHDPLSANAKGTYQSFSDHDTGYDASLDTGSVASSASSVFAVRGSITGTSSRKVFKHSLRLSTSNSAAEHYRSRKEARGWASKPAINNETAANGSLQVSLSRTSLDDLKGPPIRRSRNMTPGASKSTTASSASDAKIYSDGGKKQGTSKPSTHPTAALPASYSSTLAAPTLVSKLARNQQPVILDKALSKNHSCCIGVLSQFEEKFLDEADKRAILEGGCHGLCGIQVSASAISHVVEEGHETDSQKSSPCVKGPYDKRARFISAMPSIMAREQICTIAA